MTAIEPIPNRNPVNEIHETTKSVPNSGTALTLAPEELARFEQKIAPRKTDDGCEEWTGARGKPPKHHYGTLRIRGKTYYAHRVSYEIANGPIPPGIGILHRCDNPPCVRVSHLFAGTPKDNSIDMRDKGRWRNRPHPGSTNGFAKLDEDKVRAIRTAYANGARQVDLGADFGVTQALISLIVQRRAWQHVEPTAAEVLVYPAIAAKYNERAAFLAIAEQYGSADV